FHGSLHPRDLHSFPTRRSSDLLHPEAARPCRRYVSIRCVKLISDSLSFSRTAGILCFLPKARRKARECTGAHSIPWTPAVFSVRSEEHTSELQSRSDLVCRLLL